MAIHQLSYDEAAVRDGEPYLNVFYYDNGLVYVMAHRTISEAILMAPIEGSISELAKVEEVAVGSPARQPLAVIVDGVWLISGTQKELTMAKVKAAAAEDAANALLGVRKPRAKEQNALDAAKAQLKAAKEAAKLKAAKLAAKNGTAPAAKTPGTRSRNLFADHQRIKKVGDRNTRPDSNVGKVIAMLKPNMTVAEFSKALDKSGIPFTSGGILSFLVKSEVVQVK